MMLNHNKVGYTVYKRSDEHRIWTQHV